MAYATTSHVRSTAPIPAPINTSIKMEKTITHSTTSAEGPKPQKRKGEDLCWTHSRMTRIAERGDELTQSLLGKTGTRSVSTLTPSQLARKRANDREAQRAIRARTKEHIERLERELEQLKSQQNRDEALQELMKRNKALEDEIKRLKALMPHHHQYSGERTTNRPLMRRYQFSAAPTPKLLLTPSKVYDEPLQSIPASITASRSSSYTHSVRASPDAYGYSHIPTPDPPEPWAASIPPVTLPSTVSSPASSGPIADYDYMATTMSTPSVDLAAVAPTSVPYQHNDVEYAENGVDSGK